MSIPNTKKIFRTKRELDKVPHMFHGVHPEIHQLYVFETYCLDTQPEYLTKTRSDLSVSKLMTIGFIVGVGVGSLFSIVRG